MKRRRLFVLVIFVVACRGGAACGDIVVSSMLRSVLADSDSALPQTTTSTAPGLFMQSASSPVGSDGVVIQVLAASQTSTTPNLSGPSLSGQGRANASYTGADGATVNPVVDSLFDVAFAVDAVQTYTLTAAVTWFGTFQPIDGFAVVELRNVTQGTTLSLLREDAGQFTLPSPPTTLVLQPGIAYRLFAEAKVFGPPNEFTPLSGTAEWSFNLSAVAVPEVGSLALVGVAATGGGLGAAWRRLAGKARLGAD